MVREIDTKTWIRIQEKLAAYVRTRTREWITDPDNGSTPTVRELARRYRIPQADIQDMIEGHEDLDLIIGVQIPGMGCFEEEHIGDYQAEWIGEHLFEADMDVEIEGKRAKLLRPYSDIKGGWIVDPPIEGFRYWNEDAMKVVK